MATSDTFDDFVIARNPDETSTLPYLVRLPLPSGAVILKVRDTWPRTAKVHCHRSEDRPPQVFKLERVRTAVVADDLAGAAVRYPSVPIHFAETRPLAQEWAYRFLGAAVVEHRRSQGGEQLPADLPTSARPVPEAEPTTADVRAWARSAGLDVPDRGRLRPEIWAAFRQANPNS